MPNPQWPDRLRQALLRQGLPSDYVSRLVDELSDHAADLYRENPSMDAERDFEIRLGTPEQVAAVAAEEFRRRTFAGRHPAATFVAGPVVVVSAGLVACVLTVVAVSYLVDFVTAGALRANDAVKAPPSRAEMNLMQALSFLVRFAPFALSAGYFARLARRSGLRTWGIAACGITTLAALCFTSQVGPATPDGMGAWMLAVGWRVTLDQLLQAAVPLALGAWLLRQSFRRPTEPLTAQ